MQTNVYVDAFNVYYGCLRGSAFKWLDLGALSRRLLPRDNIHRIRYFTALVAARPPTFRQPQRQQAYLRALRTTGTPRKRGTFVRSVRESPDSSAFSPNGTWTAACLRRSGRGFAGGFGRRDPHSIPGLLQLHAQLAAPLASAVLA